MPRWHFSSRFVVGSVGPVPPHLCLRLGRGTGIIRFTMLPPVRRALPAAVLRVGTIAEADVLQVVEPGVPRVNQ